MKMKINLLCIFILVYSTLNAQEGYNIKININDLKDTSIILGQYLNKKISPNNTIRLDNQGFGEFKGKMKLKTGMYFILINQKSFFPIIIDQNQNFSISTNMNDFTNKIEFTNSKINELFFQYQSFQGQQRSKINNHIEQQKKAINEIEKNYYKEQIKAAELDIMKYNEKLIAESENSFLSKYIKATLEIVIPSAAIDKNGKNSNPNFQYNYYKHHFFDNIDLCDISLLHTPIYEDKINTYLDRVVQQVSDTVIKEVDKLILKSRCNDTIFKYMLQTLQNKYLKSLVMGYDAVAIHIAKKYYLNEAKWEDSLTINDLKNFVKTWEPLMLGKQSPNPQFLKVPTSHFISAANNIELKKNVHIGSMFKPSEINKEFTILIFLEADCMYCNKLIPEMYEIYKKIKSKGVEVIAISTLFGESGKLKWIDFINKYKLYDWINAWNPYDYKFKEQFNITDTPQIFILDKNKKIIAKKITPDKCENIINYYLSKNVKK